MRITSTLLREGLPAPRRGRRRRDKAQRIAVVAFDVDSIEGARVQMDVEIQARLFGSHEVFHALVVVASGFVFANVVAIVHRVCAAARFDGHCPSRRRPN